MLAHDLVERPTQDLDLFTPDPSEVTRSPTRWWSPCVPRAPRCGLTSVNLGSPDSR